MKWTSLAQISTKFNRLAMAMTAKVPILIFRITMQSRTFSYSEKWKKNRTLLHDLDYHCIITSPPQESLVGIRPFHSHLQFSVCRNKMNNWFERQRTNESGNSQIQNLWHSPKFILSIVLSGFFSCSAHFCFVFFVFCYEGTDFTSHLCAFTRMCVEIRLLSSFPS